MLPIIKTKNIINIIASFMLCFEAISWFSLMAPANLPTAIQRRLNQLTKRALYNPEVKSRLLAGGLDPSPGSPQELSKLIAAESRKWSKVIQQSGAKVEP